MTQGTKSSQEAEKAAQRKRIEMSEEAAQLVKKSDGSNFLANVPTPETIAGLAETFASKVPPNTYSIAQLQGFLLCSKRDPHHAVASIDAWVEEQLNQEAAKQEKLAKRALERAKWLKMEKFREKRNKQMELEAEKELLAEAEAAEKEEDEAEKDGGDVKPVVEGEASASTDPPQLQTAESSPPESSASTDKDSEPEMVETPSA